VGGSKVGAIVVPAELAKCETMEQVDYHHQGYILLIVVSFLNKNKKTNKNFTKKYSIKINK